MTELHPEIWENITMKSLLERGKDFDMEISRQHKDVLQMILAGQNIFLSGAAGTGKSTFLRFLQKILGQDKNIITLAPTGVAALNVTGQTIHSFFKLKPSVITPESIAKRRKAKGYQKIDLLIIDEISMVRSDVFSAIDMLLRKNGKSPHEPFGGVQILLIGDLYQLPPIVSRHEQSIFKDLFPSAFFFDCEAFRQGEFTLIELEHIYRQSDNHFIHILQNIRKGNISPSLLHDLNLRHKNNFSQQEILSHEPMVLTGRNETADEINNYHLEKISEREHIFEGEFEGEFNLDTMRLPVPLCLSLRKGAKVMMVRNDNLGRWVNGTIGTVVEMSDDAVYISVKNKIYRVEADKWDNISYFFNEQKNMWESKIVGSYIQMPMILAWAITIHKSQGQTLESCLLSLEGGAFATGQVYVALSRCRSLEKLYLSQTISARDIKVSMDVKNFFNSCL